MESRFKGIGPKQIGRVYGSRNKESKMTGRVKKVKRNKEVLPRGKEELEKES